MFRYDAPLLRRGTYRRCHLLTHDIASKRSSIARPEFAHAGYSSRSPVTTLLRTFDFKLSRHDVHPSDSLPSFLLVVPGGSQSLLLHSSSGVGGDSDKKLNQDVSSASVLLKHILTCLINGVYASIQNTLLNHADELLLDGLPGLGEGRIHVV